MIFVKPRNAIVADLLYTMARIEARVTVLENGMKLLDMASDYGFSDVKRLEATRSEWQRIIQWQEIRHQIFLACVGAAFVLFLVYTYRKGHFVLRLSCKQV